MLTNAYSRKKRQLKQLTKQLNQLLISEGNSPFEKINQLTLKIKQLILELRSVVSKVELNRIMGAVALLFGIGFSHQSVAQYFTAPVSNPFGITATVNYAFPNFADLDGDGDLDLMVGEQFGGLKYYQNVGTVGAPQFSTPIFAPFGLDTTNTGNFSAPAFVDLDGDGDLDLMVGTHNLILYDNNLLYFENTGTITAPQFAASQLAPFGYSSTNLEARPAFADLDADGDMDLITGEHGGQLGYYENTGTAANPQFSAPQRNPFGLQSTYNSAAPVFADLDKDGDLDLLVGEPFNPFAGTLNYGARLQYFENTGTATNPQFAAPVGNPFGITPTHFVALPAFADLDNDGDLDLLVGEYHGNMIYFEHNTSASGVGVPSWIAPATINLYPLPASEYLTVESAEPLKRIEILDMSGKVVLIIEDTQETIPLGDLPKGQYLFKAITHSMGETIRKIQIQ